MNSFKETFSCIYFIEENIFIITTLEKVLYCHSPLASEQNQVICVVACSRGYHMFIVHFILKMQESAKNGRTTCVMCFSAKSC